MEELGEAWSEHMKSCDRIFLRAPSSNKMKFFRGKKPLLDKQDSRIRMIPFQTRRPTFKEIKRVHQLLSTVDVYGVCNSKQNVLCYMFIKGPIPSISVFLFIIQIKSLCPLEWNSIVKPQG